MPVPVAVESAEDRPFDAGTLCLQFLTVESALAEWAVRTLGVTVVVAEDEQEVRDAATLRGALQRIAASLARDRPPAIGDIARVNRLADAPDLPPQVGPGGRRSWPEPVSLGQVIATIARDAVHLLTGADIHRVRHCQADDCDRVFLDTSRPGTRRWCSMETCGNRAKVRAFRARA